MDIVRRCEALGYSSIGIGEHLGGAKHPLSCLEKLVAECGSVSTSLDLFVGAEVDIQDEEITVTGARHIKEELGLDYLLGAAHGVGTGVTASEGYIRDHHRNLMALVRHCDFVDVIAHPWVYGHKFSGKGTMAHWCFGYIPEDIQREFVLGLADHGKAIELNRKAQKDFGDPLYRQFVNMLKDADVPIAIGSDAHRMAAVGTTAPLDAFLQEMRVGPEQIWTPRRK